MKTLVTRIKTTLQGDATLSTYVQSSSVQVVSPDLLPDISDTILPFVGIAPVATGEAWRSTGIMDVTHTVRIYIVQQLEVYETAFLGDTTKPSIFELLDYVKDAVRAKFFASGGQNYLSKPSIISNVRYTTSPYGDNIYLLVGAVDLVCIRQITVTTS